MEILIEHPHEDYLDKILAIQEDSLRFLCDNSYNSQQIESLITNQKRIRNKYCNREKVIIAQCNDEYIGFASLDMMWPQITGIYIHSHYSRQGVGTKLIKKLEELAVKKKYKVLYVISSVNAIKFYETNGYSFVGWSGFWSDNQVWIPCTKMKKVLVPKTKKEKLTQTLFYFAIFLVTLLSFLLSYLG